MDRKDQGRKEPSLADLEAFEKLLRESLQVEQPAPAATAGQQNTAQPAAMLDPTRPASSGEASGQGGLSRDQAAMAELARLIDQPIDFALPPQLAQTPTRHDPSFHQEASPRLDPLLEPPSFGAQRGDSAEAHPPHAYHAEAHHLEAQVETTLPADWAQPPRVTVQPAGAAAPAAASAYEAPGRYEPETAFEAPATYEAPASYAKPAEPADPLAAFEQELRRFDAIRAGERKAAASAAPDYAPVATASPAYAASDTYATPNPAAPAYADDNRYAEPTADQWCQPAASGQPQSDTEASLQAAEERLAAQAAAAAASAETGGGRGRSRGIFLALGGLAVAGSAVLAGSLLFGSGGSNTRTSGGTVPVIAARPEPAKERPANPGGMEIPNQNKQVLSPRNATDTQPAQVVNNTEQPLDLNQVTRRDGVRVVAPSPYQQGGTTPSGDSANPSLEPRRVTSIRIPVGGDPAAVPAATTTTTSASPAAVSPSAPVTAPTPPVAPPRPPVTAPSVTTSGIPLPPLGATPPAPNPSAATATAPNAPKVESRPNTAPPRPTPDAARPNAAQAPRVATTTPSTTTPAATPNRNANAPLVLSPNTNTTRPPQTAARPTPAPAPAAADDDDANPPAATPTSGSFAVQLASRPTEDDARRASTQLRSRFGSALGGKAPSVVSGTANGQTVYRVRVGGYSQAAATEACNKVKAAGGSCFVTRQ